MSKSVNEFHALLAKADPDQRAAIEHPLDGGPAILVAAAGSGKTFTLTGRVKWLIDNGITPWRIVAVTFTNKAAEELKERLGVGDDPNNSPLVSTIHSLALSAIRRDPIGFGLKERITPLDTGDQLDMIGSLVGAKISGAKRDSAWAEFNAYGFLEKVGYHRARGMAFASGYTPEYHAEVKKVQSGYFALPAQEVALWAEYENKKTCHPAGTLIDVITRPRHHMNRIQQFIPAEVTPTPIESLHDGDIVTSWRRKDGRIIYSGRKVRVASRNYRGEMLTVVTSEGRSVDVTPDHQMWVRFNADATSKVFVYLMYREGFGFRIGTVKFHHGKIGSGFSCRLNAEGGEKLWILRVCDDNPEAVAWEQALSAKYGIPQTLFVVRRNHSGKFVTPEKRAELIRLVFDSADPENARRCLRDTGLLEDEPLLAKNADHVYAHACGRFFKTAASNVIPGLMNTPAVTRAVYSPKNQQAWRAPEGVLIASVSKRRFNGPVYSLDVEVDHTYVANGVVVGNCANTVDFDDMVHLVVHRGASDPVWAAKLGRQFHHVLVDESQDTSPVQWAFLDLLVGQESNDLFSVGDCSQSIFGFQGARPDILFNMTKGWRNVVPKVYKLERNYRSVPDVIRLANNIQSHMTETIPLTMVAQAPSEGACVSKIVGDTAAHIGMEIGQKIAFENRSGVLSYKDNAILVRSKAAIKDVEMGLIRARVPYVIRGGVGIFQSREAKDLVAYLKVLSNPRDAVAFTRAVGVPKRGVGDAAMRALQTQANKGHGGNLILAAMASPNIKLAEFGGLLHQFQKAIEANNPGAGAIMAAVSDQIGYRALVRARCASDNMDADDRLALIDRVMESIDGIEQALGEHGTLEDLVFRLAMDQREDEEDLAGKAIISTIHASKGLEFTRVFVTNLYEGALPHRFSTSDAEIEEERRLAYVAVTRAKKKLVLCVPRTVQVGKNMAAARPSRFIQELLHHKDETPA